MSRRSPLSRGLLLAALLVAAPSTAHAATAPPGRVRISVGTVRISGGQTPVLKYVYRRSVVFVPNGGEKTVSVRVARTPVRVELRIKGTFRASTSDARNLGAQVGFTFVPAKQPQH